MFSLKFNTTSLCPENEPADIEMKVMHILDDVAKCISEGQLQGAVRDGNANGHWPIYFAQRTGRRVKTDNAGGSEARRERREPGSTPNYLCPGINPVRRERPDDRRSGEA